MTWTISATDFKAQCLDIVDRLATGQLDRVVVTQSGRPAAVLTPPDREAEFAAQRDEGSLHGVMRGSVLIPGDIDLAAPICDETFTAETGQIHG